jgi:LysM repeat protein
MSKRNSIVLLGVLGSTLAASEASAQDAPVVSVPNDAGGETQVTVVPGQTSVTTTTQSNLGPSREDLEGYLPSSSRSLTDASRSNDSFDLNQSAAGAGSARGGKDSQYVLEGAGVPQAHSVRRGDTLWGISGQYYKNPYQWPKLWAQNPQVQNPHWIYPGDRIRLRADTPARPGLRFSDVGRMTEGSVFLRDVGWVDDPDKDAVGELVGSPDDQALLAFGDDVYLQLDDDAKVQLGQELTLFTPLRTMRGSDAEGEGELVAVRGTVRVDRYNPKTQMVKGRIIEALDVIERGVLVGNVGRKFNMTAPVRNEKFVQAHILTALYPHEFFGQNQVLFLDRGSKHGVKPGNRFFVVERGDRWVQTLGDAGPYGARKMLTDDDREAVEAKMKKDGPVDAYPNETYGEVRVVAVRENSCLAVVTQSTHELERDAVVIMKKGY